MQKIPQHIYFVVAVSILFLLLFIPITLNVVLYLKFVDVGGLWTPVWKAWSSALWFSLHYLFE